MDDTACRVLVVDDQEQNVNLVLAYLENLGCVIDTARDGPQCLAAVEREPPDLILLDVMMPGMSGFEVCRRLKANPLYRHIPIILLTVLQSGKDRLNGLEAGADDFISKPFNRHELIARVKSLLRVKRYQDTIQAQAAQLGRWNEMLQEQVMRQTEELRRSRERLVNAREEERRRLRRDLHDGLGAALTSMTLKLDATRNLLGQDPDRAEAALADLKETTQAALAEVRRLIYDLRPPALDELGLVCALRQHAAQYNNHNGLQVSIEVAGPLPPLPAAVELAAYRITVEALTNVVRHAQAHTCVIRLSLAGGLCLEIADDGLGLPEDYHPGVGLTSMIERAAELGGRCTVGARPGGGVRILARLPLPEE